MHARKVCGEDLWTVLEDRLGEGRGSRHEFKTALHDGSLSAKRRYPVHAHLDITADVPDGPKTARTDLCSEGESRDELFVGHETGKARQPADAVQQEAQVRRDLDDTWFERPRERTWRHVTFVANSDLYRDGFW